MELENIRQISISYFLSYKESTFLQKYMKGEGGIFGRRGGPMGVKGDKRGQ
jgi:hypothetical protein